MEKRLIDTLLRIVASEEEIFPRGAVLDAFCRDYSLGALVGQSRRRFSPHDKQEIRALLIAKQGIDPDRAKGVGAWKGATRAESLDLGVNEKLAGGPVKRNRISVKPLPGRAARLNGHSIVLFPGAHLDLDWTQINLFGHPSVLVVENYETFDALERTRISELFHGEPEEEPLVIYRGDKNEGRKDSLLAFLERWALPAILFGDLDPASLVEASRFPRAQGLVAPFRLNEAFHAYGNTDLYRRQAGPAFDALATSASYSLRTLHGIIHLQRKGLVQECTIGRDMKLCLHLF